MRITRLEILERYPALRDSDLSKLVDGNNARAPGGAMSYQQQIFYLDEEELQAAHAAAILRRQGESEDMVAQLQASMGTSLQQFIGAKLSRQIEQQCLAQVRAELDERVRQGEITGYDIDPQHENGTFTVHVTAVVPNGKSCTVEVGFK